LCIGVIVVGVIALVRPYRLQPGAALHSLLFLLLLLLVVLVFRGIPEQDRPLPRHGRERPL
jgi:Ca2+/Na+ antiporter